jgi:ABC-type antimicrobial peptide transport system permease subunit
LGLQALLAMAHAGRFALPVEVPLDLRVLGFAAAVSMLTTVLFGLAPALRATRVDLVDVPWTQMPWGAETALAFEVRTAGDVNAVMTAIRRLVRDADPLLPVMDIKPMEQLIDDAMEQERLLAWLVGFFGAITLVLACVGLYGMAAYSVTGRTREIGLRMALGADRAAVLGMILRQVLITAGAGIAIGIPAALAATRVVRSLLYGVKANDTASFLAASGMVLAVVVVAVAVPARRAMATDPVRALRYE